MKKIIVLRALGAWTRSKEATRLGISDYIISPIFGCGDNDLIKVKDIKMRILQEGVEVVIIDNQLVPKSLLAISEHETRFAGSMQSYGVETFFLNNRNPSKRMGAMLNTVERLRFDSELWRWNKPVKLAEKDAPIPLTAEIAEFQQKLFAWETGEVQCVGGGDSGQQHIAYLVRNNMAYFDHDWPGIIAAIGKELAS